MNDVDMPQYQRIAADIARRISEGEIEIGDRLSGRSMLASEYSVSPETIRRALKQLSVMKVVEIRAGSGVYVISRDNARRYIESMEGEEERRGLENRFRELVTRHSEMGLQILDIASEMTRVREVTSPPMPYYEEKVGPNSPLIGRSIGELQFWQATGATIVGIRRGKRVILSPGPKAELYAGDSVIFVCELSAVEAVRRLVNGGADSPRH